ncbi:polyamine-transporting ATPase 13A3-like isoform X2 [Planococcus citri]
MNGWDSRATPTPTPTPHSQHADDVKFSVHSSGGIFKKMERVRYFNCRKSRFIWDSEACQFYKLNGLDQNVATSYFHQQQGLSSLEQYLRRAVYGTNEIIIPQRGVVTLLFFEILNPFYVFQFFSFVIWCLDDYVLYATAIMIMTVISIIGSGLSTYFNQRELHKRVCSSDVVHIIQGNEQVSIPTEQLVPGDILVLPTQGCVMYCDAVLLNGSCIANESALTGESDPVMKTPIPNAGHPYENKEHARHTLYCGTEILQTRFYGNKHVLAMVIRTGFSTTKGAVMRTLLYPAPTDYKFEKHSYKFVEFLAAIAGIGFLYTIVSKSLRGLAPFVIAMEALDLITVVVPPALPAAMTIGAVHALLRLKKRNIFCISPRSINVSGSVNCICFDKTGTLTEEGLNMWGVIPTSNRNFCGPVQNIAALPADSDFLYAMVTCHTLTIIREKLCGDPMDLKIFESTGWQLEEPAANDDTKYDLIIPTIVKPAVINMKNADEFSNSSLQLGKEIGIVRHFTFSSSLQRMTVITRVLGASNYNIYCKGAPESICNLCVPESVPADFHAVLKNYTRKGYRVIATAFRPLPSSVNYTKMQRLSREEVESELVFLGLIVLENKLKPETTPVISKLKDANLRLVIVTGDNLLTAVSVARDCGIILPEQDVIAIQCVEAPVPHIYYTYADVSPITSSISSPAFNHKLNSDGASTDETHLTELSPSTNVASDATIIPFDCAANIVCSPPKNYVFALTGANWMFLKQHFPELIPYIGIKANIFSRMNPDQKQNLVREMQALGYVVAMCGDGANDCGALKAAHTGISLSNNESSAASPFTSKVQDIRCILDIIKEGRAALVTSFALFKFMALYSLTQFVSLMILYSINTNLTDVEFLYIDLFIIACCAFSLGHTPPYQGKLASKPPPSSLISLAALTSLLLQTSIIIAVQVTSFLAVQQYNWFTPYNATRAEAEAGAGAGADANESSEASYENYAVFSISALQYVILTIAFHKGPPYVGYICSNYILIVCLISITSSTLYLILTPAERIVQFFELKVPQDVHFRIVVVLLAMLNLILSLVVEIVVCDYLLSTVLKQRLHAGSKWRKLYANVEHELVSRSDWPTVSCDVDYENANASDNCADSCARNALLFRGSQTIPRRLSPTNYRCISSSVPNINKTTRSNNGGSGTLSDVKLACVSSQTTVQSDYFTPNENLSFIFTS